MKPLSERDENLGYNREYKKRASISRNEATLWKRWEQGRVLLGLSVKTLQVGMKPLSERDENIL